MHFNIHPWDVGRLSVAELHRYLDAIDEMNWEADH